MHVLMHVLLHVLLHVLTGITRCLPILLVCFHCLSLLIIYTSVTGGYWSRQNAVETDIVPIFTTFDTDNGSVVVGGGKNMTSVD